ncbi:MAG: polymer-forming cytoskeletal protein [Sphingomonas sp.]|uniref:bactofilin family protein n=1 Tax=Sphingomonas sp. TaxID=28214 RepID=UPI001AD4F433|nr:polymer-forming cytoskeletal protein [Sphingomonas sp.]MBN8806977.1 polymer-forming cytoskeletal protein [Sphingomonas sp.]
MFNKRDDAGGTAHQPAAVRRTGTTGFSVLGADVVVTGNVRATADLHVEGRIEGDVDCGNLVLGAEATIKGQVRGETARLAGAIEGSVAIRQLTIEASARITGDVEYEAISIENGARIDGHLRHTTRQSAPAVGTPRQVRVVETPSSDAAA